MPISCINIYGFVDPLYISLPFTTSIDSVGFILVSKKYSQSCRGRIIRDTFFFHPRWICRNPVYHCSVFTLIAYRRRVQIVNTKNYLKTKYLQHIISICSIVQNFGWNGVRHRLTDNWRMEMCRFWHKGMRYF